MEHVKYWFTEVEFCYNNSLVKIQQNFLPTIIDSYADTQNFYHSHNVCALKILLEMI